MHVVRVKGEQRLAQRIAFLARIHACFFFTKPEDFLELLLESQSGGYRREIRRQNVLDKILDLLLREVLFLSIMAASEHAF